MSENPAGGAENRVEQDPAPAVNGFRSRFSDPSGAVPAPQQPQWQTPSVEYQRTHSPAPQTPAPQAPAPEAPAPQAPPTVVTPQASAPAPAAPAPQPPAPKPQTPKPQTPQPQASQPQAPQQLPPSYYGPIPAGAQTGVPARPAVPPTPYPDLTTSALLRQAKTAPTGGWRRGLYLASGKLINVGESAKTSHHYSLLAQVNQPLQGCYRIAVLSLKGGVGKTTITATLGATFASIRGDRVVAVDANPDLGTLSQKVTLETAATVRHLLRDSEGIQRYSDVRRYTSQGPSRLEVLASESDPAVSEAFSSDDYRSTLDVLERFYSLVLTDCGTGLMHSAMSAVLDKADTLIVISSGSVDGARSASATLDWLDAHGHEQLVKRSVAVINAVRPRSGKVDMQKVVDHFSRRCHAVRLVPFDPHLEEGAEISLERLRRQTREALVELAAVVADGFPNAGRGDASVPPTAR